MRYSALLFSLLLGFILSNCGGADKETSSENNVDAARNFIRAALDGKFREARALMLNDSVNTNYLDLAERAYKRWSQDIRDSYRTSSIVIHQVDNNNDSTTIVIYSNTYKNDHDTLRVIKQNDQWLVDLKYLYQHDEPAAMDNMIINDSIQ